MHADEELIIRIMHVQKTQFVHRLSPTAAGASTDSAFTHYLQAHLQNKKKQKERKKNTTTPYDALILSRVCNSMFYF